MLKICNPLNTLCKARVKAIILIIGCAAVLAANYALSCHDLKCLKQKDTWFRSRFAPDMPIYLTAQNSTSILSEIQDEKERAAINQILAELAAPAEATLSRISAHHPLSCAVVGNSGNLTGSHYGPLIDSHDYVFRMNNAPLKNFEGDVGKRTTFHIIHSSAGPIKAYDANTITIFIVNDTNAQSLDPEARKQYINKTSMTLRELGRRMRPDIIRNDRSQTPPFGEVAGLTGGLLIMHPDFVHYVGMQWFTPQDRDKIDHPSQGFKAIILALHLCDKVDAFGFGSNYQANSWDHYFDKGIPLAIIAHQPQYQEQFLDDLDRRGIIHIYRGNRW